MLGRVLGRVEGRRTGGRTQAGCGDGVRRMEQVRGRRVCVLEHRSSEHEGQMRGRRTDGGWGRGWKTHACWVRGRMGGRRTVTRAENGYEGGQRVRGRRTGTRAENGYEDGAAVRGWGASSPAASRARRPFLRTWEFQARRTNARTEDGRTCARRRVWTSRAVLD